MRRLIWSIVWGFICGGTGFLLSKLGFNLTLSGICYGAIFGIVFMFIMLSEEY